MADENVTQNESSEPFVSIIRDPFDYDNEDKLSPLEKYSFDMDDDSGELVFKEIGTDEGEEKESSETGSQETKEETNSEDTVEASSTESFNPFEGVTDQRTINYIREQDERIKKLEAKLEQDSKTKSQEQQQKARGEKRVQLIDQFMEKGFDEDQAAILADNLLDKEDPKKEEEKEEDLLSEPEHKKLLAKEAAEVLRHYDGKNAPDPEIMKPAVQYVYQRFGDELGKYPLTTAYRVAENAPFIEYLYQNFPEQTRNLTVQEVFITSEKVRRKYYADLGKENGYDHLYPAQGGEQNGNAKQEETSNKNQKVTNNISEETIRRLSRESKERSLGVPGGSIETEQETQERQRPKSAREVAESTVLAMFGNRE